MHDSAPSISLVLPTRNRREALVRTLGAIGALAMPGAAACELIIVDNASNEMTQVPKRLANGIRVELIRLATNEGAAARSHGVHAARGAWILMLDDDSHPRDGGFIDVADQAPPELAAIGGEIHLPSARREDGGLPEVIIGCGALIRRDVFLAVGGYDPAFQFYAEEYDLCAKIIRAGHRITHDHRVRVLHEKTSAGRDMNLILHRLVRNNGWTLARHAPESVRERALTGTIERYRTIAKRENAMQGFRAGLAELEATLDAQQRTPLSMAQYDRFTGLASARETLQRHPSLQRAMRVALIEPGKHAWAVRQALEELPAITLVEDEHDANALIISTLSPGPMLDAAERRRSEPRPVIMPWRFGPAIASPPARTTKQVAHVR